jgi:hypothetical protein
MPAWLVKKIPLRPILGWYLKYKGKVTFSFYDKENLPCEAVKLCSRSSICPCTKWGLYPFLGEVLLVTFLSRKVTRIPRIPADQSKFEA